jgi:hypothetical protein
MAPDYGVDIDNTEFVNLYRAIEIVGSEPMNITNNIFDNCIYGIHITNNPVQGGNDLTMTCNHFQQPYDHSFNRYGLFLEKGSQMNDVGGTGQGMPPGPMPNGNGFPVNSDPNVSEGWDPDPYQACFGTNCLGNVGDWEVPEGWYSIYDANAVDAGSNASFQYFRYDNEFVGDVNNRGTLLGVYPLNIVVPTTAPAHDHRPTNPNSPTCDAIITITFPPVPKIQNLEQLSMNSESRIFPNPTKGKLIQIDSEKSISSIRVLDITGKIIEVGFDIQKNDNGFRLHLEKPLRSGIYLIELLEKYKNPEYLKLIIE